MDTNNPLIDHTKWILKWLSIILIGVVTLFIIIEYFPTFKRWYNHDRHVEKIYVEVTSKEDNTFNDILCAFDGYPYLVIVENLSDKTITSLSLKFSASKIGHSTNLLYSDTGRYDTDKIIAPYQKIDFCHRLELGYDRSTRLKILAKPNTHSVGVEILYVKFRE